MEDNKNKRISRREFLISGIRFLLIAGLGFTAGFLILRKILNKDSKKVCFENKYCNNCIIADKCVLSGSLSFIKKNNIHKGNP